MLRPWTLLVLCAFTPIAFANKTANCAIAINNSINEPNPLEIHIGQKTYSLVGTYKTVELIAGYQVFAVYDSKKKKTFFIDPEIASLSVADGTSKGKNTPLKQKELINKEKIKKHLCENYKKIMYGPNNRPLAKLVRKNLMKKSSRLADFMINASAKCAGMTALGFLGALGSGAIADVYRVSNRHNTFSEHQSNFSVTLFEMTTMHQCLGALGATYQKEFLNLALTTGVLTNVYFDLNLGGKWQIDPTTGTYTVTDVADLSSGALSVMTYAALGRALNTKFNFSLMGYCK